MEFYPQSPGIYLWHSTTHAENPLKTFLALRRSHKVRRGFAFAQPVSTLHRDLSLAENFLAARGDFPQGSQREVLIQLRALLLREELASLTAWFPLEALRPGLLSPQEKTVAAVCLALFGPSEDLLMDLRGVDVAPACLNDLRNAIQAHQTRKRIIIVSDRPHLWQDYPADQLKAA